MELKSFGGSDVSPGWGVQGFRLSGFRLQGFRGFGVHALKVGGWSDSGLG